MSTNKVFVNPGEDIQAAVNSLENGGVVELGAGTHHITRTVYLRSDIVLTGVSQQQACYRPQCENN